MGIITMIVHGLILLLIACSAILVLQDQVERATFCVSLAIFLSLQVLLSQ